MRMENTVCVFTLHCFGLLRQTARQLRVLTPNGKNKGSDNSEPHKRFPPLRSPNGAVSAALQERALYVAQRRKAGEGRKRRIKQE